LEIRESWLQKHIIDQQTKLFVHWVCPYGEAIPNDFQVMLTKVPTVTTKISETFKEISESF
jgi:hypothetical protein